MNTQRVCKEIAPSVGYAISDNRSDVIVMGLTSFKIIAIIIAYKYSTIQKAENYENHYSYAAFLRGKTALCST